MGDFNQSADWGDDKEAGPTWLWWEARRGVRSWSAVPQLPFRGGHTLGSWGKELIVKVFAVLLPRLDLKLNETACSRILDMFFKATRTELLK